MTLVPVAAPVLVLGSADSLVGVSSDERCKYKQESSFLSFQTSRNRLKSLEVSSCVISLCNARYCPGLINNGIITLPEKVSNALEI